MPSLVGNLQAASEGALFRVSVTLQPKMVISPLQPVSFILPRPSICTFGIQCSSPWDEINIVADPVHSKFAYTLCME